MSITSGQDVTVEDNLALRDLKARYFRCVDLKEWDEFETLFAPDAVLAPVYDLPGSIFEGARVIRDSVALAMTDVVSVHHGHTPEFRLVGPDEAHGIWPMEDMLWFGSASVAPGMYMHGLGHYREIYRRVAGRWAFARVELHRVRVEHRPA